MTLGHGAEQQCTSRASTRAKVEHPILYVKWHFGYAKVRYRGLAKITQRLTLLLGMTNLIRAERYSALTPAARANRFS